MDYKIGIIAVTMMAMGCGAGSPKAYAKRGARIGCRSMKKCDDDAWKASKYDSVAECIDDRTKEDDIEAFEDACKDFDKSAARDCLKAGRKYKRSCDESDLTSGDGEACIKVCGDILPGGQEFDPMDPVYTELLVERGLEIAEALYDDELEDEVDDEPVNEPELTVAPSP